MDSTILRTRERVAARRGRPSATVNPVAPPPRAAERMPEVAGPLPREIDRRLLAKALTIRRTEERLLQLFAAGKIAGTVHTCVGQEWAGVAIAEHLRPGDFIFSNHRGHGHYIAWTDDVEGLVAELMGRATGVCGGRGGSQHLCRDGFFSNGIQGGIVPVTCGLAMAQAMTGRDGVAVAFIGDGTWGEGAVYEALNIAGRCSLPLIVVVEDNGIAQSTESGQVMAGSIAGRAEAFDVQYAQTSTEDPVSLLEEAGAAVRRVREQRTPLVFHLRTRRLNPHSKGDDTRDPELLARLAGEDPLNQVLASDSTLVRELVAAIDRRLDQAVSQASAAPPATVRLSAESGVRREAWTPLEIGSARVVDLIRSGLANAMDADERLVILGEDVRDPYGGAFKVTSGLSTRHDDRVLNMPISEAAIAGIANGLAMAGYQPVIEIMFGDFLLLAADQVVNHAAKFPFMFNGKVSVPVVIRTPMGGYRGYGPTHSQSLEKHLLGVPGLRVLAVTHRWCPGELYRRLLGMKDSPTLVIENKLLYGRKTDGTPPPGCVVEISDAIFPTIRIRPVAGESQLTIVAYGGMVPPVENAVRQLADEEDLQCEVLIPTQLYPLETEPVIASVCRTGRLLVVEEGQGFAGFGSELVAQVACRGDRPARFARISAEPCPIPAAKSAEAQVLPDAARIVRAARQLAIA
jgi:2-oxoisovalerate dehydrogenase E1 component